MDNPTDAAVDARAEELRSAFYGNQESIWPDCQTKDNWRRVARLDITRQPGPEDVERLIGIVKDARTDLGRSGNDAAHFDEHLARAILALYPAPPAPAYAPTRSALDSALDPMLGNTPVRTAVVDAVLRLFDNARRPLTGAQIWEITKGAYEDRRFRQKFGPAWDGKSFEEQLALANTTRYILTAASWPMTAPTDSAASDRLAWLEKTHSETMDQNVQLIVERDALNACVAELEAAAINYTELYFAEKNGCEIANDRIATLESELAAAKSPPPGTIRLGEGLTEAQEEWSAEEKIGTAEKISKASDALTLGFNWACTTEGAELWARITGRLSDMAAALRASATPKPEAVDWVAVAKDRTHRCGKYYSSAEVITGLCEQIAALRAGGV